MITTAPRLLIRRPSPTTADFTVTTLPESWGLLCLLLGVLRLLLTLTTLLFVHACWINSASPSPSSLSSSSSSSLVLGWPASSSSSGHLNDDADAAFAFIGNNDSDTTGRLLLLQRVLSRCQQSWASLGLLFARLAEAVPWYFAVPLAVGVFWALSRRVHAHESLLVLRGLGVQTTESPRSYLASAATRFIPTEKIQDIFVNEAFRGFEVRYHLVVVVEGEEDVVVVFPGLLPRRRIVEEVWRGARECLYEAKRDDS
ncbi:hypothetical protein AAL_00106 [Moelleriella libera RCEF 2490]|uniref:Phosphatidylinositol N-acetylglucosaminyltransferase subunit H conserved domain-containing protein n=1 Tax=Moelleriella libera RCEF 2490 TaxID=1081109 RepID=A0A166UKA7_9HYPO|nr:hypothetical protein AAL_00106 [Moelleriella libera RCEF 2490]